MPQEASAQIERARDRLTRTTGQEVLFLLALAFVVGFGWWWYQAWSLLFVPPALISPQGIFTLMISAVYALVLPLFGSMLLPNSPAGWLLQQQTWAYPGQLAVLVATIVLGFFGGNVMRLWLLSQGPVLEDTGMFYPALAAALVGAYLVPALQFAYMTPTQQLIRIQQAHDIRKLKIMHDGEVVAIEARLQWLAQKAAMDAAELLPGDQREVVETLRGLFKGITDVQRRLARTVGVKRDVMATMGLLEDERIDGQLDYVERLIGAVAEQTADAIPIAEPAFVDAPRAAPRGAATLESAHVNSRLQSAIPRAAPRAAPAPQSATERQAAPYGAQLRATAVHFGVRPWSAKQLAAALAIGESTAREIKSAWVVTGFAAEGQLGRWYLTERAIKEAANGG